MIVKHGIKVFKQDCSLEKALLQNEKKKCTERDLIIAKNKLLGKYELLSLLESQKQENELLKKFIQYETIKKMGYTFYDEKAIIKIQTQVRGWLCRRLFEKLKTKKLENEVTKAFDEMFEEVQNKLMIGELIKNAASLLQRNIKIFLFRKKIKRIKNVFEKYYLKSTENFLRVFKNTLFSWSAKNKIINLKFLKYREGRLKEIREKLAILQIKHAIMNRKFNIRAGKALYQRLNRKRKQLFSIKVVDPISDCPSPANPNFFQLMQELENESITDPNREEALKSMKLMKKSYNIKEVPEINFIPLLGKQYYLRQNFVKSASSTQPEPQKFRSLSITTPPLANQKRMFWSGEIPSKLMAYPIKDITYRPRPLSSHSHKVSEEMNFLKPTEFFKRKINADKGPILNETQTLKRPRPPSKKLMRNTASSEAKRRTKMSPTYKFTQRDTKTVYKDPYIAFHRDLNNWKSFDACFSANVVRRSFIN